MDNATKQYHFYLNPEKVDELEIINFVDKQPNISKFVKAIIVNYKRTIEVYRQLENDRIKATFEGGDNNSGSDITDNCN